MLNSGRIQDRIQKFQEIPTEEKLREKRNSYTAALRKTNRSEKVQKRRALIPSITCHGSFRFPCEWIPDSLALSEIALTNPSFTAFERFTHLCELFSPDKSIDSYQDNIQCLRVILSENKCIPYEVILNSAVPFVLTKALDSYQGENLHNVLWSVINIVAGPDEMVRTIVNSGGIPSLIRIYEERSEENIKESTLWALTNILCESNLYAHAIFNSSIPYEIIANTDGISEKFLKNKIWFLSELFNRMPELPSSFAEEVVKLISKLIVSENLDIVYETLWLVYYFSSIDYNRKLLMNDCDLCSRILCLMFYESTALKGISVKVVGNLAIDSSQVLLDLEILDKILALMNSSNENLKNEAIYVASALSVEENIANAVIGHSCFGGILNSLENTHYEIKINALKCICVLIEHIHPNLLFQAHSDFLEALSEVIDTKDPKVLKISLKAIEIIFKRLSEYEIYHQCEDMFAVKKFDEFGGVINLENLQQHPNTNIYQATTYILQNYIGN